jgi:hypothetical protein
MSINAIGSGNALQLSFPTANNQRQDPEAYQAAVNAQADLLQAVRHVDLPAKVAAQLPQPGERTDGGRLDVYL